MIDVMAVYNDPHLPECIRKYPSIWPDDDVRVMTAIRKLRPGWWARLSEGYTQAFNHHGAYLPHQEYNARRRAANLWLFDIVRRFS